jgi:hypothetical protein
MVTFSVIPYSCLEKDDPFDAGLLLVLLPYKVVSLGDPCKG